MTIINSETVNLTLRTWDIFPDNRILNVDNSIGTISCNGAYLVWKNINLIDLLGDLWKKYDNFNLCLKIYAYKPTTPNTGGPTPPAQNPSRNNSIWISGLTFNNGKIQNGLAIEQAANANTDAGIFFSSSVVTFNKLRPIVDIALEFKTSHNSVVNDFNEKPTYIYGHHTFLFDIVPCK